MSCPRRSWISTRTKAPQCSGIPRRRRPDRMDLLVQPEDGLTRILTAIKKAKSRIELTIFRFDRMELQKALEQAVARGVKVHALIAHQAAGEGKKLRKLELELLDKG